MSKLISKKRMSVFYDFIVKHQKDPVFKMTISGLPLSVDFSANSKCLIVLNLRSI